MSEKVAPSYKKMLKSPRKYSNLRGRRSEVLSHSDSAMAYTPPHKRHISKDSDTPAPTPSPFLDHHHRHHKTNPRQPKSHILYAEGAMHRWFVLPSVNTDTDDTEEKSKPACAVRLKEFPDDVAKPMMLLLSQPNHDVKAHVPPWVSIQEKIHEDLIHSFQVARSEMCKHGPELNIPRFVIRFGKILFYGASFVSLDDINEASAVESILSPLKRRYNTNLPHSFIQTIITDFVPKIGFRFHQEKEHYQVKVSDKTRPHTTISCKCTLIKDTGELDIYKIELNEVRRLVVDISCLDKNLDLRLLLSSKRILASITDDEKDSLISLVKSAIIDSEVKGGLRWPLGKESLGDRYTVVGAWHTKAKIFRTSYAKLKVIYADRFDFKTSIGEVSQEASLWIPELKKQLRDETLELDPLVGMVTETLKLVWEHFLSWGGSFI